MDIKQKLQELCLPLEYADGSFAATINHLDLEEAKKIGRYLFTYGVRITKASEIKWYTLEDTKLNKLLARLQYCKDAGILLVDEKGNNKDYVFDNSRFVELYPNVDLSAITPDVLCDKEAISEDVLTDLEANTNLGLTEDNYDRYVSLESKLTYIAQELNGTGEISPIVTNNIIKLINSTKGYSDAEIIFGALVYGQNHSAAEIAKIKQTIEEVLQTLTEEGKRNL